MIIGINVFANNENALYVNDPYKNTPLTTIEDIQTAIATALNEESIVTVIGQFSTNLYTNLTINIPTYKTIIWEAEFFNYYNDGFSVFLTIIGNGTFVLTPSGIIFGQKQTVGIGECTAIIHGSIINTYCECMPIALANVIVENGGVLPRVTMIETIITLKNGGTIQGITADNSNIYIDGGSMPSSLNALNSNVLMSGGDILKVRLDNSAFSLRGGNINSENNIAVVAINASSIYISGGNTPNNSIVKDENTSAIAFYIGNQLVKFNLENGINGFMINENIFSLDDMFLKNETIDGDEYVYEADTQYVGKVIASLSAMEHLVITSFNVIGLEPHEYTINDDSTITFEGNYHKTNIMFSISGTLADGKIEVPEFTTTPFSLNLATEHNVTVNNGTGSNIYITAQTVTITADQAYEGLKFEKWITTSLGVTFADAHNETTTFVMPANDVTVTAYYVAYYTLIVNDGTGSGDYAAGKIVNITANAPETGMRFKKWETTTAGVTFTDAHSPATTFTMPETDVTVTALFEPDIDIPELYTVTVINGTANGAEFEAGETVLITANAPSQGLQFEKWTSASAGVTFANENEPVTTFTMPENDVIVVANYVIIQYSATVINGTGSGDFAPGEILNITANTPETGMRFANWSTETPGVAFTNPNSPATTFTMPNSDVIVTALFEPEEPEFFKVTVINGTANYIEFEAGETVTITANPPSSGLKFEKWTTPSVGVIFTNENESVTTFTMPENDVIVVSNYVIIEHSVTVNNGTGSGNYAISEIVTITANTPETGMRFKNWTSENANVFFSNANAATTSFIMPNSAVVVTANYEQDIEPPVYYMVMVVNGTANGTEFEAGATVTITAEDFQEGLQFVKWSTVSSGVTFANENNPVTTFQMPANFVMVIAHYVTYPVNINGGTGGGNYVPGETVTINAYEPKNETVFVEWVTTTPNVIFADPHSPITTFIMPNSEVNITAVFKNYYSLTVDNGTSDKDKYEENETVTITANEPAEGMQFTNWSSESENVVFTDSNDPETTFIMPANDVIVKANYEPVPPPKYTMEVINGTADGTEFEAGATVTIIADDPAEGMQFKNWTSEIENLVFANANDPVTTFMMPENDVTVTANYEPVVVTKYKVEVIGGTADGVEFEAGATVTITANNPAESMQFKNWTSESEGVTFADPYNPVTTFIMPENDVIVKAIFDLGIVEVENTFSVYPNPTHGQFTITGKLVNGDIQIFETAGKMCYQISTKENDGTNTFDISHLPAGVYFLKFDKETLKIVKK